MRYWSPAAILRAPIEHLLRMCNSEPMNWFQRLSRQCNERISVNKNSPDLWVALLGIESRTDFTLCPVSTTSILSDGALQRVQCSERPDGVSSYLGWE